MKFRFKGPGPLRLYECPYYSVEAPPTSCWFCKHLTDVFFDYTNGPYMFFCDLYHNDIDTFPEGIDPGLIGMCEDFEEG